MPYDVSLDKPNRTLVVRGYGKGTTEDTIRMIEDAHETLRSGAADTILYDSVDLEISSSPADMMRVSAALFQAPGVQLRRIALVVPQSRAEFARVFAALSNDNGVRTNVFTDTTEALRWLGSETA